MNLDPHNPMFETSLVFHGRKDASAEQDLQSTVGAERPSFAVPSDRETELARQVAALEEHRATAVNLVDSLSETFAKSELVCHALGLVRVVLQGEG